MILLSFVEKDYEEKYSEHIKLTFQEWEKIKNRIVKPLKALYEDIIDVDKLIKLMLLFHDSGKLVPIYQQYLYMRKYQKEENNIIRLKGYRHEFVSSIICLDSLKNSFIKKSVERCAAMEICGAILFHHSFWVSKINISLSDIDHIISNLKRFFKKEVTLCEEGDLEMKMLSSNLIGSDLYIKKSFSLEEAKNILRELYRYLGQQGVHGQKAMLRSTALLQILCVCDNRAASKRGPKNHESIYFKEILNGGLLGG